MDETDRPDYDWWPNGASPAYVGECNCEWCRWLIGRLRRVEPDAVPDSVSTAEAPGDERPTPEPVDTPEGVAPLTEFTTE